jgi:hypothetical protein
MTWFHLVMVNVRAGVTIEDVQRTLQASSPISWYRIANNLWVVHSFAGAQAWAETLYPLTVPGGTVFVSQLKVEDTFGWLDPKFWQWLQGQRSLKRMWGG